jgi:hypothetical protein
MDNDKENIICGRTFEMVVGHWSSMNQPAGTPTLNSPGFCPVWENARLQNAAKETAKSKRASTSHLVNSKPIKMLNLRTFTSGVETLVLT